MQLSGIDANLIVVFHVLLEELSVSGAARRLGLSPSATSHALARLRELLADPLLVRSGQRMSCTPRAEALRPVVQSAVASMEKILKPPSPFCPGDVRRTVRIATSDHLELVLVQPLCRLLSKQAPGITVQTVPIVRLDAHAAVRDGRVDFAFSAAGPVPSDIHQQSLTDDAFVTVLRRDHPIGSDPLTLARFASLSHVMVSPTGELDSIADNTLGAHGLERRVVRVLSTFWPALFIVAQSDCAVTLPRRFVEPLLDLVGLQIRRPPISFPAMQIVLLWHRSQRGDPALEWLRESLVGVAHALPPLDDSLA